VKGLQLGIFLSVLVDQFGTLTALTQDPLDFGPVPDNFNVHLSLRWEQFSEEGSKMMLYLRYGRERGLRQALDHEGGAHSLLL